MKRHILLFCCALWSAKYAAGNDITLNNLRAWDAVMPPAYTPEPAASYGVPLQWQSPYAMRQSSGGAGGSHPHSSDQPSSHPQSSYHSMDNAAQYSYGTVPALGVFSAYGISPPPPRGPPMLQSGAGYTGTSSVHSGNLPASSQSNRGCSFVKDDDCFGRSRGCAIKNAMPFERRAMLTLESCKTCCLSYVTAYFSCESFVYNRQHRLCDMFAHRGDVAPAILVPTLHHDYYEVISEKCRRSGPLSASTWPTPKPAANVSSSGYLDTATHRCKSNEKLMYYKMVGRQLITKTNPRTVAMSAEECVETCAANQGSEGSVIPCHSFEYFPSSRQCAFHVGDDNTGQLVENPNAMHFAKTCFPGDLVSHCTQIILREPKKVLIGYARTVLEIKSVRECIEQCLRAPSSYGYTCSSGVFYNEENSLNCILNSETKEQHADLMIEERQSDVEYFQLFCGEKNLNSQKVDHVASKPEPTGNAYVPEKPLQRVTNAVIIAKEIGNDWTIWSPCETGTNIRKRYQVCDQLDIRDCPQEVEHCRDDTNSLRPYPVNA